MEVNDFSIRWNKLESNLVLSLKYFYEHKLFSDVTVTCGDRMFNAHKLVLAACSPYFERILLDHPQQHPIIHLTNTTPDCVVFLMEYMYTGSTLVQKFMLQPFFELGGNLKLKGLSEGGVITGPEDPQIRCPAEPQQPDQDNEGPGGAPVYGPPAVTPPPEPEPEPVPEPEPEHENNQPEAEACGAMGAPAAVGQPGCSGALVTPTEAPVKPRKMRPRRNAIDCVEALMAMDNTTSSGDGFSSDSRSTTFNQYRPPSANSNISNNSNNSKNSNNSNKINKIKKKNKNNGGGSGNGNNNGGKNNGGNNNGGKNIGGNNNGDGNNNGGGNNNASGGNNIIRPIKRARSITNQTSTGQQENSFGAASMGYGASPPVLLAGFGGYNRPRPTYELGESSSSEYPYRAIQLGQDEVRIPPNDAQRMGPGHMDIPAVAPGEKWFQGRLQFMLSQRGKPLLVHDGHSFGIQYIRKDKKYWQCNLSRKYNCKARVTTTDTGDIIVTNNEHCHTEIRQHLRKDYKTMKLAASLAASRASFASLALPTIQSNPVAMECTNSTSATDLSIMAGNDSHLIATASRLPDTEQELMGMNLSLIEQVQRLNS